MSVDEVVFVDSLEGTVCVNSLHQFDVEVRRATARSLVSFTSAFELSSYLHAGSHKDFMSALLLADSASIKSNYLTLVVDNLACSAVEVLESAIQSHMHIGHGLGKNLIESSKGSSEIGALDLGSLSIDDLSKRILFQEEVLEDLVAVLLVDVASSPDTIGANNT